MPDYPQAIVPVDHVEPVPRRIRAVLDGRVVIDTTAARYVWEWPYYPQYYIPFADIAAGRAGRRGHTRSTCGGARPGGSACGSATATVPGWPTTTSASDIEGIAGTVRFDWAALDALVRGGRGGVRPPAQPVHPGRRPAVGPRGRGRARRAWCSPESSRPVLVFETGLPTRYYLDRLDVDFTHLVPSDTVTVLPLQGDDQRLLVGRRRRHGRARPGLGLRLPDPPAAADRRPGRLLQREGRR